MVSGIWVWTGKPFRTAEGSAPPQTELGRTRGRIGSAPAMYHPKFPFDLAKTPAQVRGPNQECDITNSKLITPVLTAGCAVLILNFGIPASFGMFQIPIAAQFDWSRSDFSMAIAIQNLAWGIGQPIFGALAERFGDRKAIIAGALMYAAGLVLSSLATTPGQMQMLAVLVGFGIASTGFGTILAIVGRASRPENRSLALGIASGIGSGGQVIGAPIAQALLQHFPWQTVFVIFAAAILCVLFALPFLRATCCPSSPPISRPSSPNAAGRST